MVLIFWGSFFGDYPIVYNFKFSLQRTFIALGGFCKIVQYFLLITLEMIIKIFTAWR